MNRRREIKRPLCRSQNLRLTSSPRGVPVRSEDFRGSRRFGGVRSFPLPGLAGLLFLLTLSACDYGVNSYNVLVVPNEVVELEHSDVERALSFFALNAPSILPGTTTEQIETAYNGLTIEFTYQLLPCEGCGVWPWADGFYWPREKRIELTWFKKFNKLCSTEIIHELVHLVECEVMQTPCFDHSCEWWGKGKIYGGGLKYKFCQKQEMEEL